MVSAAYVTSAAYWPWIAVPWVFLDGAVMVSVESAGLRSLPGAGDGIGGGERRGPGPLRREGAVRYES